MSGVSFVGKFDHDYPCCLLVVFRLAFWCYVCKWELTLTNELRLNIDRKLFIVNQVKANQQETISKAVENYDLELIGMIPEDETVRDFDLSGRPTMELDGQSNALSAAYEIFKRALNGQ